MCGRFTLTAESDAIAAAFHLDRAPEHVPRYNIAPSQPIVSIVVDPKMGTRECRLMQWGLIPSWGKDPAKTKKAGVIMLELVPEGCIQGNLLSEIADPDKERALMQVLDQINGQFGPGTLRYAVSGTQRSWSMRTALRSPRYLTSWDE